MDAAPRIETERLVLRASEARDLDGHAAMLGDAQTMRYIAGPLPREDAWRRLLQGRGLWAMLGYGYWTVARREDDLYIGQIGFADFKRDLLPSIVGLPEMGWLMVSAAHGQGLAAEAVRAALGWAETELKAPEVVAIIAPENAPSVRLAERTGFVRADETLYRDEPTLIFRRRSPAKRGGAPA
jgi:RimJ/RimL family protein N-acetyltransferase